MQFNQANHNTGDVNNVISTNGNAVQSTGSENKIQVDKPKDNVLVSLWKWVRGLWSGNAGES